MRKFVAASLLALALGGCNMAPAYVRPAAPVAPQWPQGAAYAPAQDGEAGMPWRKVISDPKLTQVVEMALSNSRSLREQVAAVAQARATYRIARSAQLPTISAGADASLSRGLSNKGLNSNSYDASAGMSSFTIDLFGRLRNQSKADFESYLASQSGLRSARLTLVEEVATAYVTYASDSNLLALARETVSSGERTLALTQSLFQSGLANGTDVESARTVVESAKSDVASYTTATAQDRNALDLLVGKQVDDTLLPKALEDLDPAIANVPAGLSSAVLLRRPDVVEAEHQLIGANASVGAARAAFFPTISLTSTIGVASTALSSLFTGGAASWNLAPSASVPLLGGSNRGNLAYARATKDYYLAAYEKVVQTAFRDVANGLAQRGTIRDQRAAQERYVAAARKAWLLAQDQFKAGIGTYQTALTAQRTYYAAQQSRIATLTTDLSNRLALYGAIGADDSL
ncbi:efflux transporter outer membrane subunit [Novosphingobium sediminicola]|uniref:Multidrug efflux system outer membrane protein n=1 Tax=Novosphingobium sediminicola TaxID=563162 RepID=A0A7W6G573_9SPHN|nr:efflux transporter outer membrane subunit [Novosphingobium sediminicola]MBB3954011.1 multidrug efflux system outer membrane protein [Novosphingobium sediminicola]